YALIAVERQGGDLLMNGIMAAVTIAANLALIPRYGALCAAMATLGSIVVYALLQYEYLRRWAPTVWTPIRLGRLRPRLGRAVRRLGRGMPPRLTQSGSTDRSFGGLGGELGPVGPVAPDSTAPASGALPA